MSTRHVILGLLAQQPMSGYDIKTLFKGLSWMIDTPSYGSLYPTLHALLDEGLVSVDVEPGDGKPSRKLYSLTPAGREALKEWLSSPSTSELSIRTFVRQLIIVGSLSSLELRAHLMRRRSQIVEYLSRERGEEGDDELREYPGRRLVDDYSRTIAEAELTWLDTQLAELSQVS
ncbi:MAG: PadR family transcriptional regulator [Anaerolineae bacterium]